jgi:3-hydroxyacyl-[acyl-carrier-protein] dehydratase
LDHPCYAGHFPGNPVVPGVLLLELICEALERGAPRAIPTVKFHQVLRPGDACELTWKVVDARVNFHCARGLTLVAEGSLDYGAT